MRIGRIWVSAAGSRWCCAHGGVYLVLRHADTVGLYTVQVGGLGCRQEVWGAGRRFGVHAGGLGCR
jgi:hypothetical protein